MESILNICDITGSSVSKFSGTKKYIATGDIIENKIINYTNVTYENKPSRANQIAKVGDILFAKMKDTKKVIIINENNYKNIYSTGFFVITPKENILSDYLYCLFNSPKFNNDKNKNSKGATQKALNNEGLKKIKIKSIPKLLEQRNIVNKINKIQSIIDIRNKQLKNLDELIKSQFVYYDIYLKMEVA